MCLIAMAWGMRADYPLIIASNRDEFYARPTAPLAQWTTLQGHTIISGRDLRDGGTWLGFTPQGRFAMLTNVRQPIAGLAEQPLSRGALVVDWLSSRLSAADWSCQLHMNQYAGFNLVLGDWVRQQCYYLSNQPNSDSQLSLVPTGQVIGLSNAALNTPWPKTLHLVGALEEALQKTSAIHMQERLDLALRNTTPAPEDMLTATGMPLAQERALSSAFVRYPSQTPVYGTRSSLVAMLNAQGVLHLHETTHASAGQVSLQLPWPTQHN